MENGTSDLLTQLLDKDVIHFGAYVLKSGLQTPVYVDLRKVIAYPQLLDALGDGVWKCICSNELEFDYICGVPYAALPIATCLSVKRDLPMVIQRKEVKDHGTRNRVEGVFTAGSKCLVIEDVVTSGLSVTETAEILTSVGLTVSDVVVVMDRNQGAEANLQKRGIKLHSLFRLTDVLNEMFEAKKITDEVRQSVVDFLASNQCPMERAVSGGMAVDDTQNSHDTKRSKAPVHPKAKQVWQTMMAKKTNLCVAADLTSARDVLKLADEIGDLICMIKIHADIISDFTPKFSQKLKAIAMEKNFLICVDRKFSDIGATTLLQLESGPFRISDWADFITVHVISGPGVFEAIGELCQQKNIGCLVVCEMSSRANLISDEYTRGAVRLGLDYSHLVAGFICQKRPISDQRFLYFTPADGDSRGQAWRSVEQAVSRDHNDCVIVGRGVTTMRDHVTAAATYRDSAWAAFAKQNSITTGNP